MGELDDFETGGPLVLIAAVVVNVVSQQEHGWDLLEAINLDPTLCDVPVVALSAADDPLRASVLSARDFLVKPVNRAALLSAITAAIASDRFGAGLVEDSWGAA